MSLLDSIHQNYVKAASTANKDKLVESVEGIGKTVQAMLAKVEARLAEAVRRAQM